MKQQKFPCKGCGNGCFLEVAYEPERICSIEGNRCENGRRYAEEKLLCQRAEVYVPTSDGRKVLLRTAEPIPLSKKAACLRECEGICMETPVIAGEVVLYDAAGTGVSLVAAETVI